MTVLGILWFFLIFLLIAGYFIFDGFDLGAGVLYPFIAKTDTEKAIIRRSIGPIWDGNEVWLLTAGGALFAAFAPAYATTFSGFYLAIMLVLFGLILRAVAVEFAAHDSQWAGIWNICFFVGSLLPALLTGVAVGNIYAGIPMDAMGNYNGIPLLGLVTPFTLLCGLLGLAMFCCAGAAWIALKAPATSELRERATKLRFILQIVALILFVLVSLYGHFVIRPEMAPELAPCRWICAALYVAALALALFWSRDGNNDLRVFIVQSVSAAALTFLLATSMFPNFVVASADSIGPSITIATAASGDLTLAWMTGITVIGVVLVLIYHVFIYRTFRGRITEEEATTY